MGTYYSPETVNSGLVFAWDKDNQRSYRGPFIQNLCSVINPSATSGTNILYTTGYANIEIPTVGYLTNIPYVNGYNSNSASFCCMQQFHFVTGNGNVACAGSTTYTYAILYKCTSGYTHPNYMYRYEYTSGGAFVTESGVHNASNRIHLGDDWYWAWATFTTQATTAQMALRFFYYQYNISDTVYVAKVMVAPGNYTGLHPRLWPDLGTTRAATTSIYDLLGSSTSSAGSLTFDSTGNPSFDGANHFIRWNNNTALDTQTPTVEVWVKTNSLSQNGFWFEKGTVNTQYSLFQSGSALYWRTHIAGGINDLTAVIASYMNTSNWYHVVGTYTSGTKRLYINGVLVNSSAASGVVSTNAGGMFIGEYGGGAYRYNGQVAMTKVYNRNLTPAEVLQNFNANKGRFGY